MNVRCAGRSLRQAESISNQPARSTSGNRCILPERGGHSSSNVLLLRPSTSNSPRAAHAWTVLPPACCTLPSEVNGDCGAGTRSPPRTRGGLRGDRSRRQSIRLSESTRRPHLAGGRTGRPDERGAPRSARYGTGKGEGRRSSWPYPAVTYREQEKDRGLYPVQAGPSPTLGWISHPVLPGDTPARTFTHIPGGLAWAFGPSATGTPSPVPILELLLNC